MGKSTISMAIFNSFLYVYQRVQWMIQSIFNHKNAAVASRYAAVAHTFHVEKVQEVLRRGNNHFGWHTSSVEPLVI